LERKKKESGDWGMGLLFFREALHGLSEKKKVIFREKKRWFRSAVCCTHCLSVWLHLKKQALLQKIT
jgi:hypothetical protein